MGKILFLFFCSGATALVYEVIWSKYLTLLFGSTIEAQTVVLAVFMGGLALGNKLFSRCADNVRQPLLVYGGLEIAVGIYAFLFPWFYRLADAMFVSLGSNQLDHTARLLLLKGMFSAALLLVPTLLMGGTLPVLAAWLQKTMPDAGRRSARFYSTNSLGAVCGAGLSGFFLVPWLGLHMTMAMTALVNVLIGFVAVSIGRTKAAPAAAPNSETTGVAPAESRTASAFHWGCVLVALTGAVSMSLEVLASRCLALIFGASLQVFAIVLMAFILGIGIGSALVASPRWKHLRSEGVTVILLLGTAVLIGLLVFDIGGLATIYLYVQSGLSRSLVGFRYHEILTSLISLGVLGLPAAALGAVLPLCIRVFSGTADLLGDHVGRLLTWNTLGAVVGVLLTGFVFMPKIGLRGSFAVMGFILVAAAIGLAAVTRRKVAIVFGVIIGLFLTQGAMTGGEHWRNLLSAGIFRLPDMDFSQKESPVKAFFDDREKNTRLLFYEDAADATVSVEEEVTPYATNETVLRINGKPDASAYGDRPTQILLAQLPLMVKPDSQDVFCFGMGSGVTAGSTLDYPIAHLTIAENCEPVLRAVKLFAKWNRGVFTNDRVRIYHEDARTVLKLDAHKYDVIISEPSNPWTVGIGSVFSREFYQLAARRLKPGGIMTQWFHMYEMDDATLNVVLRTFASVFPHLEIWDVGDEDIVLLGSDQAWPTGPDVYQAAFQLAGAQKDLASIGLLAPKTMLTRQFASQATAFAVAGPGPLQSDDVPVLEYNAPKAFYMYHGRRGVETFQNYDERTWQMSLAPVAKNETLVALDTADLMPIFGKAYGSGNPQLQSYLDNRFQGHIGSMSFDHRIMPCILQDTNGSLIVYAPPSAATNMVSRRLYFDEVAFLKPDLIKQAQAVDDIKNILDGLPDSRPEDCDWSPAYYADLAVKASLRQGNILEAKAILTRGLQLEPDSDQLAYLSRIMARE